MAIVKQSTAKPFIGEMRVFNGIVKEYTKAGWVAVNQVRKQKYNKKQTA